METAAGVTFLNAANEIYRQHQDRFYRVAGVGDVNGGDTIFEIAVKAATATPPLRALVEVRYGLSPGIVYLFELLLDEPRTLAPRFGETVVHPQSRDRFIPLSHLTLGHSYWPQRSENLTDWNDLRPIANVEPQQDVVIPRAL